MLGPALERGPVRLPNCQLRSPCGKARGIADEGCPGAQGDERPLACLREALGIGRRRGGNGPGRSERSCRPATARPEEAVERIQFAFERSRLGGEAERSSRPAGRQRRGSCGVVLADPVLALQPVFDHTRIERSQHHGPTAGANRLEETLRMRAGEHQVGVGRRLLEDLEDVVGRVLCEPIGSSDHRHPSPTRVRRE